MANFLFLADIPGAEPLSSKRADYDQGSSEMPRFYVEGPGWIRATRIVIRKANPSRHECDARCVNASGRTMQCECSCGGKNHGRGMVCS